MFGPFSETAFPATQAQTKGQIRSAVRQYLKAWKAGNWQQVKVLTDIYDDYPDPAGLLAGVEMSEAEWGRRLSVHQKLKLEGYRFCMDTGKGEADILFPYGGALNIATVQISLRLALDNFLQDTYGIDRLLVTLYVKCHCRGQKQVREDENRDKRDVLLSDKPWLGGWQISLNTSQRVLAVVLAEASAQADTQSGSQARPSLKNALDREEVSS